MIGLEDFLFNSPSDGYGRSSENPRRHSMIYAGKGPRVGATRRVHSRLLANRIVGGIGVIQGGAGEGGAGDIQDCFAHRASASPGNGNGVNGNGVILGSFATNWPPGSPSAFDRACRRPADSRWRMRRPPQGRDGPLGWDGHVREIHSMTSMPRLAAKTCSYFFLIHPQAISRKRPHRLG
jgi:hypothetical protein